ncbi:VIT domain-containing protein [Asticcacaulis solisilvae]|uniref:VIT domain-containing protein n=1 Tax=Asticcacaulis solisilvae TaxID=1217274 RepID=UPI003FD8972E
MPKIPTHQIPAPLTDPLAVFMAGWLETRQSHPLPLIATEIDVEIASSLAVVETRRRFRNTEDAPIEAVMTFPVPVHAVLFALEARIDGRHVIGHAQSRQQAHETYEAAVETGKAAVLHEEVLRGIHTLSVANIRPGGEIEVTLRWAASLNAVAGQGALRIPLTVGDIYGFSGLPEADQLTHEVRAPQSAQLHITCTDGAVTVAHAAAKDGDYWTVPLNRPVDLVAPVPAGITLSGTAADGRTVDLTIGASPRGEEVCRLAVLTDFSGSMRDAFGPGQSKHTAAIKLVKSVAGALRAHDYLDLWQFDTVAEHVATLMQFDAPAIDGAIAKMSAPRGGTEIGGALNTVLAKSEVTDILLVTDGQSYALDVQALAKRGRRISVLLIGEGSLEARVGHLATLTGGAVFIATPSNLAAVAEAMLGVVRSPFLPIVPITGPLDVVSARRGGMDLTAHWTTAKEAEPATPLGRAVAAFAAALALPALDDTRAGQLAEAEGLVTHLTSLVLVDEAGEGVDSLPNLRKVALETPMYMGGPVAVAAAAPMAGGAFPGGALRMRKLGKTRGIVAQPASDFVMRLEDIACLIGWDAGASRLMALDLSGLPTDLADEIKALAEDLLDKAQALGLPPMKLALALLAHCASDGSRSASRLARIILGKCDPGVLNAMLGELGLAEFTT